MIDLSIETVIPGADWSKVAVNPRPTQVTGQGRINLGYWEGGNLFYNLVIFRDGSGVTHFFSGKFRKFREERE